MPLEFKSIKQLVCEMKTEEEVLDFAKGRSLAAADSSRIEGLVLDQEKLTKDLFEIYQAWRIAQQPC